VSLQAIAMLFEVVPKRTMSTNAASCCLAVPMAKTSCYLHCHFIFISIGRNIVKFEIDSSKRNEYNSKRYEIYFESKAGGSVDADDDPTR
jgi:hypothetical protein